MANYATLKAAIQQVIKTNGNEEITGALLQQSLLAMINSLGGYYQFAGIATPTTNPGTPDQNVYYIASTAGTYANFGGLVLADGEIAILKYNGAWSKDSTGAASLENVNQLNEDVNGKPKNYSDGHYLKNDGTIGDNAAYGLTDFIPYTPGNSVLWKFNSSNGAYYIGFYRADKTYISGSDFSAQYNAQNGGRLITVANINQYAPNAAYIRASFTLAFTGAEVIVGNTSAWTPQERKPSLQEQIDALQIETEEARQIAEDAENSLYVDGQKVVVADYITGNVLSTGECRNIGTASGYGFTYIPVSRGKQYHISGTFGNTAGTYAGIVFNETMLTTGAFATVVDMGVASGTINYDYVPESDGYLFAFSGNAVFTEKTQEEKYLRGDSVFSYCLQSPLKLVGVADSKMYVPMSSRTVKEGTTYRSFVIPVSNGDKYRVRGRGQVFTSYAVIAFATSLNPNTHAEVFLSVSQNDSGYVYDTIVNIPADGYLIVFTNTLTYGSAAYVEILPLLDRITIDNDYYLPDSFKLQTFGDSITDSSWGDLSSWVNYVPDNIPIQGLTIINSGIGGFSFAGLQNLMENGGTNSGGGVAPALQNDVDMITIFLGTNDWSAGVAIDSVKASFKNALDYFFTNNKAKVLVCTPLQRYSTTTDVDRETNADGEMLNSAGYTLRELCDMIIKVCGMYSVPVLDLNAEALINKFNIMDYSGDGLHPNRCGDIYVSRLICKKIKEMLRG